MAPPIVDTHKYATVCEVCRSRTKGKCCTKSNHFDGYVPGEICPQCHSLDKKRSCTIKNHAKGKPLFNFSGPFVLNPCMYCRVKRKLRTCLVRAHFDGQLVLLIKIEQCTNPLNQPASDATDTKNPVVVSDHCNIVTPISDIKCESLKSRSDFNHADSTPETKKRHQRAWNSSNNSASMKRQCRSHDSQPYSFNSRANGSLDNASSQCLNRSAQHDADDEYYGLQPRSRNRSPRSRSRSRSPRHSAGRRYHEPYSPNNRSADRVQSVDRCGRSRERSLSLKGPHVRREDSSSTHHAVRKQRIEYLEAIIRYFGFEELYSRTGLRMFSNNPSMYSTMNALQLERFGDVREKIERMYETRDSDDSSRMRGEPSSLRRSHQTLSADAVVKNPPQTHTVSKPKPDFYYTDVVSLKKIVSYLGADTMYDETGLQVFRQFPHGIAGDVDKWLYDLRDVDRNKWAIARIARLYARRMRAAEQEANAHQSVSMPAWAVSPEVTDTAADGMTALGNTSDGVTCADGGNRAHAGQVADNKEASGDQDLNDDDDDDGFEWGCEPHHQHCDDHINHMKMHPQHGDIDQSDCGSSPAHSIIIGERVIVDSTCVSVIEN